MCIYIYDMYLNMQNWLKNHGHEAIHLLGCAYR